MGTEDAKERKRKPIDLGVEPFPEPETTEMGDTKCTCLQNSCQDTSNQQSEPNDPSAPPAGC